MVKFIENYQKIENPIYKSNFMNFTIMISVFTMTQWKHVFSNQYVFVVVVTTLCIIVYQEIIKDPQNLEMMFYINPNKYLK